MSRAGTPDSTKTLTPPVDCWVTVRVGGDRVTKVEVEKDEQVRVEVRRRETNA